MCRLATQLAPCSRRWPPRQTLRHGRATARAQASGGEGPSSAQNVRMAAQPSSVYLTPAQLPAAHNLFHTEASEARACAAAQPASEQQTLSSGVLCPSSAPGWWLQVAEAVRGGRPGREDGRQGLGLVRQAEGQGGGPPAQQGGRGCRQPERSCPPGWRQGVRGGPVCEGEVGPCAVHANSMPASSAAQHASERSGWGCCCTRLERAAIQVCGEGQLLQQQALPTYGMHGDMQASHSKHVSTACR